MAAPSTTTLPDARDPTPDASGRLRVLGVDPGLAVTGYGLVDRVPAGLRLVEAGAIRSRRSEPLPRRVEVIHRGVSDVLEEFHPGFMALEDLYSEYEFPKTALLMAHVRGAVCLAAAQHGVTVVSYTASEVKNAVVGMGKASKEQVQGAIQHLFGLASPPSPNDVADAIALAVTGAYRLCGPLARVSKRVR